MGSTPLRVAVAYACLVLAASGAFPPYQSPGRTTVPFDLGWRFHWGVPEVACPADTFPVNMTGRECTGLQFASAATDTSSCAETCCAAGPACQVWQFDPANTSYAGCWYGIAETCQPSGSTGPWISFARNGSAGNSSAVPPYAEPTYADADWAVVDAPHDFIITGPNASQSYYGPGESKGQAFLPKGVGVYRKHFGLPAEWKGTHIELYVEGMYASATYYLNGRPLGHHQLGYTSAFFRLDNASGLVFGGGPETNLLAVFVDATAAQCTGWWYEGGGLFRHSWLFSTSAAAHIVPHGLGADIQTVGRFQAQGDGSPAAGLVLDSALVEAFVEIASDAPSGATVDVAFALLDAHNATVATGSATKVAVSGGAGNTTKVRTLLSTLTRAQAWSVARPYLYTLMASVSTAADGTLDSTAATVGVRKLQWDADQGFFLNNQPVKHRGFCDHESFTAVGMAVPDRINLFRFQSMRGMGGNARRTSHNPPAPNMLDLADRLGLLILDENRVFQIGDEHNMGDLVARDRNHPSIVFWSFCNEPGCNNADKTAPTEPTYSFKYEVEEFDGTRAVTGNMCVNWGSCPNEAQYFGDGLNMSFLLDVQGFSHVSNTIFEAYHARWPTKPLAATECCSCETMRGEDGDLPHNASRVFYSNENAKCAAAQTSSSNALDFVAGTYVWTAFDYYGEPDKWPHISSSFGQWDLAGFPKAAAHWYQNWWLNNISAADPSRVPLPAAASSHAVHIVEAWQAKAGSPNRTINVYSSTPLVQLQINGAAVGVAAPTAGYGGFVTFEGVAYLHGELTAVGLAADGITVLAKASKRSWGAPASVVLSLDAPSVATGTGAALYLDGQDTALIRATILDADGNPCHDSSARVAFAVAEGPGLVWGTGNGDPNNHEPNHSPERAAYHGLLRAVVRVTAKATGPLAQRTTEALVNPDAGKGPLSSSYILSAPPFPTAIRVTASSPGLRAGSVDIPLSTDPAQSVLAVAAASVASANQPSLN